jgi:poly-gamma-glutamate system protein
VKKLYWRPSGISRIELLLIAALAVVCLVTVENMQRVRRLPNFTTKLSAARLAQEGMSRIKLERLRRGAVFDPEADPQLSGMIGEPVTAITSNTGHLEAKVLSTNPNFAAILVALLKRAGVGQGSIVAVGVSGSFPAINVATYSALQAVGARPIIIVSVAGSEWGATDPTYTWLDMEKTLYDQHLIEFRAAAASRGGIDDRGLGISKKGRAMLDEAIARAGIRRLEPESLADSISQRMTLYFELANDAPIAAYINVGGGAASVGTSVGKRLFNSGFNRSAPRGVTDSVMSRFVREGVPVIHMSGLLRLAERYGLSTAPDEPHVPGEGEVYTRTEYNPWYALLAFCLILGVMAAFLRLDVLASLGARRRTAAK